MGLESASYIAGLDANNPDGSVDKIKQGDDHLKMIKLCLKNTFPGLIARAFRTQDKAAGYTVVGNDNLTMINCTAALTLSLTAAATLGNGVLFVAYANGGDVVLDPNGAELINGSATFTLLQDLAALVWCDGTAWHVFIMPTSAVTQVPVLSPGSFYLAS